MAERAERNRLGLSVEAFRAFYQGRPDEERWELINGVPMMTAPPTFVHQRIASNLERALNDALETHQPAWAAYQRGLWHMSRANAEDNALAETFFQQAIDLDPNFAGGYKGLALAVNNSASVWGTRNMQEGFSSAEALARRAVAIDPADAEARARLGMTLWMRADYQGALAEVDRALALSPNLAYAHGIRGSTLVFSGQAEDGVAALGSKLNHVIDARKEP